MAAGWPLAAAHSKVASVGSCATLSEQPLIDARTGTAGTMKVFQTIEEKPEKALYQLHVCVVSNG